MRSGRIRVEDETLECVGEFCILGGMNSAEGGAEASSVTQVRV